MKQPKGSSAMMGFTGVKVFAATMGRDREVLGEKVTEWLAAHPQYEIVDTIVTQSSDAQFHCISISVFYADHSDHSGAWAKEIERRVARVDSGEAVLVSAEAATARAKAVVESVAVRKRARKP